MKDSDQYLINMQRFLDDIQKDHERFSYHVGDWVYENGIPHRWEDKDYSREQMNNISKIPLSKDILHLNSWIYDEDSDEWSKDGVSFCIMIHSGFTYDGLDAAFKKTTIRRRNRDTCLFLCETVDILQTLLRITNQESLADEFIIPSNSINKI